MLIDFNIISDSSQLWIYSSEKKITLKQQRYILHNIGEYLEGWEYHNNPLIAAVTILENRFLIVALDKSKYGVGGCSIDSLQRIIQDLEKELDVCLLNRLNIFCKIENEIQCIPSCKLKDIANEDTYFYDLTIQKKSEISSYLKPIKEGWCKKFI